MRAQSTKALAVFLLAAFARPCAGIPNFSPDIYVSSGAVPAKNPEPITWRPVFNKKTGAHEHDSVGVGGGLSEGPPLQMMLWGSGGAVIGSVAGPIGAIIGSAVGVIGGLLISIFSDPRDHLEKNSHAP
ncbi:MAG: hypothetical protein HY551_07925 [Elusimicrobia bacterium]|nr:hypothetical protein [Elusimicrobiota bacterium]